MSLLSRLSGTQQQRPRLAAELRPRSVVAAASDGPALAVRSVAQSAVAETAIAPSLKVPNVADRVDVANALRSALERVGSSARELTLVVPDATVRVVLLDFDTLPSGKEEADGVVRFRLKRAIPFDSDTAAVSYQVMQQSKGNLSVLVVAMPADVREEYELLVREAGFEPGVILPSTLAAIATLDPQSSTARLLLNVDEASMTTAIVRGDSLLLYRTVEFSSPQPLPAAEPSPVLEDATSALAAVQTEVVISEMEHLSQTDEIARAVSVATAYFEDTLGQIPDELLIAGSWPAAELQTIVQETLGDSVRLREVVLAEDLLTPVAPGARNLLAGVRGALKG